MSTAGFFEAAATLEKNGTPFVAVTLSAVRGHAPQNPGAKIIVTSAGRYFGTVGGGKVEAQCIDEGVRLLSLPREESMIQTLTWNLQRDVGMTCGGEVTFLFERFEFLAWSIVIFGAGHVSQALARVLEPLSCRAVFVDTRPEWLEKLPQGNPKITGLLLSDFLDYLPRLDGSEYCLSITPGHAHDVRVARALFEWEKSQKKILPYIGVIGSAVKAIKLRAELKEYQINDEPIQNFHCPIGLKLGSNDPAEIAISIAAELIQLRDSVL